MNNEKQHPQVKDDKEKIYDAITALRDIHSTAVDYTLSPQEIIIKIATTSRKALKALETYR